MNSNLPQEQGRMRTSRMGLLSRCPPLDQWPKPVFDQPLTKEEKKQYELNVVVLQMYANNGSIDDIVSATGRSDSHIKRLWDKACSLLSNGEQALFFACVPGFRKSYKRKEAENINFSKTSKHGGRSGHFQAFLGQHPSVAKKVEDLVLRGKIGEINVAKVTESLIHSEFIQFCEEDGVTANQYPICTDNQAAVTLANWVKQLRLDNQFSAVKTLHGSSAARAASRYSMPTKTDLAPIETLALERVELDGSPENLMYSIDAIVDGIQIAIANDIRPTVLAAVDVKTNLALENHTIFRRGPYTERDVLALVKKMLMPHRRFTLPSNLAYPSGPCFPTELCCWKDFRPHTIAWDALAGQASLRNQHRLAWAVGINVSEEGEGGVASARRSVEAFFSEESRATEVAPNATGSRVNPLSREMATESFSSVWSQAVVDLRMAQYNRRKATGNAVNKIDELAGHIENGNVYISSLSLWEKENLYWTLQPMFEVTLRLMHTTRMPYVEAVYSRYTSVALGDWSNLGKFVNQINSLRVFVLDDASKAVLCAPSFPGKPELGFQKVCDVRIPTGRWAAPHSLEEREACYRLPNKQQEQILKSGASVMVAISQALCEARKENQSMARSLMFTLARVIQSNSELPIFQKTEDVESEVDVSIELEKSEPIFSDREELFILKPGQLLPTGFGRDQNGYGGS